MSSGLILVPPCMITLKYGAYFIEAGPFLNKFQPLLFFFCIIHCQEIQIRAQFLTDKNWQTGLNKHMYLFQSYAHGFYAFDKKFSYNFLKTLCFALNSYNFVVQWFSLPNKKSIWSLWIIDHVFICYLRPSRTLNIIVIKNVYEFFICCHFFYLISLNYWRSISKDRRKPISWKLSVTVSNDFMFK